MCAWVRPSGFWRGGGSGTLQDAAVTNDACAVVPHVRDDAKDSGSGARVVLRPRPDSAVTGTPDW
jgi:hypothetical protein